MRSKLKRGLVAKAKFDEAKAAYEQSGQGQVGELIAVVQRYKALGGGCRAVGAESSVTPAAGEGV